MNLTRALHDETAIACGLALVIALLLGAGAWWLLGRYTERKADDEPRGMGEPPRDAA